MWVFKMHVTIWRRLYDDLVWHHYGEADPNKVCNEALCGFTHDSDTTTCYTRRSDCLVISKNTTLCPKCKEQLDEIGTLE